VINLKCSVIVVASALALVTAGCGGSGDTEKADGSAGSAAPSATTVNPSDMTNQQQAPARLLIDATIKGGEVTPADKQLQGKVGQPIVVRVNSDAEDELQVHSNPEHNFKIDPRNGQQFQFTVDAPGTVDITLHNLNRTIASVQVR
jgi:Flp pilus assembly protein TadD